MVMLFHFQTEFILSLCQLTLCPCKSLRTYEIPGREKGKTPLGVSMAFLAWLYSYTLQ